MQKKFEGYLLLNWHTKEMHVVKRKRKTRPAVIPIRLEITLEIPETKEHVLKGTIEVPHPKVSEMVIDGL